MKRFYHLSYDAIDHETNFKNEGSNTYDAAREYIMCVLHNTAPTSVKSYVASTIILEYDVEIEIGDKFNTALYDFLSKTLTPYFHFIITRTMLFKQDIIHARKNININIRTDFDRDYKKKTCKFISKQIPPFII
jgi:hypothetical protein